MKISSLTAQHLRRPALAFSGALFFAFLGSVDTTYAAGGFAYSINIPDAMTQENLTGRTLVDGQNLPASPVGSNSNPAFLVTLDLNGVASVDAKSIALVSAMAKSVELAKTPDGARQVAATLLESYDWNKTQMACLDKLWTSESHWNFRAHNYRSGAQGIAQALPPTKMEIISTDWRHNPVTQIQWGLSYIQSRYGTPCAAYAKKRRSGYY